MRGAGGWAVVALLGAVLVAPRNVAAQGSVGFGQLRPFVVGIRPVVGRGGAVGGVSIDAQGVVAQAEADETQALREARLLAWRPLDEGPARSSSLRKVSLRRLERALAKRAQSGTNPSEEMLVLAGLQRVTHVFAYPREQDVALAGPAEGWKVGPSGDFVGVRSGRPVLLLEDLLVALRTAESAAEIPISCSIDPTEEGLRRLRRLTSQRLKMSPQTLARMEDALGPQRIAVTGAPATSHFARVMVAADFQMKRLAMGHAPSEVAGLPSYPELLKRSGRRPPKSMTPRWWLAVNYEPPLRDATGQAWRLRGPGVRALTEETFFDDAGSAERTGKSSPEATRWAELMTEKYDELSLRWPVFGQLRNCVDLSVAAALIVQCDFASAGFRTPLLMDADVARAPEYPAPTSVATKSSFFRRDRNWVILLSGGVDIDSHGALGDAEIDPALPATHRRAAPPDSDIWWWD